MEISTASADAPSLSMNAVWRTIRSYILWQHERGTLHYDIMVTLILIFLFASPYWINFNDKPVKDKPVPSILHPTEVVVTRDPEGGLVYEIPAGAIAVGDDHSVSAGLLQVIQPISGNVTIVKYEAASDSNGKVQSYRVWAKRQ